MSTCPDIQELERWFDGEATDDAVAQHVDACAKCEAHVAFLRSVREHAATAERNEIGDGQMNAYLGELQGKIQRRRLWHRVMASASVMAAAVIAATALVSVFTQGQSPVQANSEIETHESEIPGATTVVTEDDDGTATVWLNLPEDEMQ